jgi:uncharacterized protein YfdQ (DUF2303 family)
VSNFDADAVRTIADLAEEAILAQPLDTGKIYAIRTADGGVHEIDLTGDKYRDAPRRKTGTVTVRDAASFLAYWAKHSGPWSEVYADRDAGTVTGVINAHGPNEADTEFGDHRVVLKLKHTESFRAWVAASGQQMNQAQFAEFIEDHRVDVRVPDAATLLELAQTFQAINRVTFKSAHILQSGQRQLTYVENIEAQAGANGQIVIPTEFELALAVYEGATVADAVTARLRYRIVDGRLALIFILDRLAEVIDTAFEGVIESLSTRDGGVQVPILRGTPA